MEINIFFGLKMKEFRAQRKISQEKLALAAGIDRTYISDIERGQRNISLDIAAKIAAALEVPLSNFFIDYNG